MGSGDGLIAHGFTAVFAGSLSDTVGRAGRRAQHGDDLRSVSLGRGHNVIVLGLAAVAALIDGVALLGAGRFHNGVLHEIVFERRVKGLPVLTVDHGLLLFAAARAFLHIVGGFFAGGFFHAGGLVIVTESRNLLGFAVAAARAGERLDALLIAGRLCGDLFGVAVSKSGADFGDFLVRIGSAADGAEAADAVGVCAVGVDELIDERMLAGRGDLHGFLRIVADGAFLMLLARRAARRLVAGERDPRELMTRCRDHFGLGFLADGADERHFARFGAGGSLGHFALVPRMGSGDGLIAVDRTVTGGADELCHTGGRAGGGLDDALDVRVVRVERRGLVDLLIAVAAHGAGVRRISVVGVRRGGENGTVLAVAGLGLAADLARSRVLAGVVGDILAPRMTGGGLADVARQLFHVGRAADGAGVFHTFARFAGGVNDLAGVILVTDGGNFDLLGLVAAAALINGVAVLGAAGGDDFLLHGEVMSERGSQHLRRTVRIFLAADGAEAADALRLGAGGVVDRLLIVVLAGRGQHAGDRLATAGADVGQTAVLCAGRLDDLGVFAGFGVRGGDGCIVQISARTDEFGNAVGGAGGRFQHGFCILVRVVIRGVSRDRQREHHTHGKQNRQCTFYCVHGFVLHKKVFSAGKKADVRNTPPPMGRTPRTEEIFCSALCFSR